MTFDIDPSQGTLSTFPDGSIEQWQYSASFAPLALTQGDPGFTHIDWMFQSPLIVPLPPMPPNSFWWFAIVFVDFNTTGGDLLLSGPSTNGISGALWSSFWTATTPITSMSENIQNLSDGGPATLNGFTITVHQDIYIPTVPEPATWLLLAIGMGVFTAFWKRK